MVNQVSDTKSTGRWETRNDLKIQFLLANNARSLLWIPRRSNECVDRVAKLALRNNMDFLSSASSFEVIHLSVLLLISEEEDVSPSV